MRMGLSRIVPLTSFLSHTGERMKNKLPRPLRERAGVRGCTRSKFDKYAESISNLYQHHRNIVLSTLVVRSINESVGDDI